MLKKLKLKHWEKKMKKEKPIYSKLLNNEQDSAIIYKVNMNCNWIYKDKFIGIRLMDCKSKTNVYDVFSYHADDSIGVIKWHPGWRHYCYFPTRKFDIILSDRCNINIGEVTRALNLLHKYKGVRKEIWGIDGNE